MTADQKLAVTLKAKIVTSNKQQNYGEECSARVGVVFFIKYYCEWM